jgi:hypothetical protein
MASAIQGKEDSLMVTAGLEIRRRPACLNAAVFDIRLQFAEDGHRLFPYARGQAGPASTVIFAINRNVSISGSPVQLTQEKAVQIYN